MSDSSRPAYESSWTVRLAGLFLRAPEARRAWPFGLDEWLGGLIARRARAMGVVEADGTVRLRRLLLRAPEEVRISRQARLGRWLGRTITSPLRRLPGFGRTAPDDDEAGAADGVLDRMQPSHRGWQALLLAAAAIIVLTVATTPMDWKQQLWFGGGVFAVALLLRNRSGRIVTLILIALSVIASVRYFWWRINHSLEVETAIEAFLGYGLFAAECYALVILIFGYVQSAWPLRRQPVPMPADRSQWPSVDVYIPSYNEPLEVVRPTVLAAQNLDWPAYKLHIYLLDDGRRDDFREFAEAAGVHYMTRTDNAHAKAGNLNQALTKTSGEFIAIFDCDHVPVSTFLTTTMGWMLRDPRCALVQTPHHFFSPDPMERNLGTFRRVPNEGRLFYGLIQDGNDLWNATFFCGSCAVLRRAPLQEVGGIAVETVTEDAHTALKMHRLGYTSVYVNKVQAAGLATENLAGHIGQRIRWARGMAQIFSLDNPFRGRGLSFFQRLCYSNAMLHFLHGIPRLVFLTAPLAYLYFGWHVFNAPAAAIAAFVVPHLALAMTANSKMQGRFRHSYWAEVYESLLAWYIALPTTLALINPRLGKFNVTSKGGRIARTYFDWRISLPFLVLMTVGVGGFGVGIVRLIFGPADEVATVLLNLSWTGYNLILLGAAVGVARENRQLRRTHRVDWHVPVMLLLAGGRKVPAASRDFSLGGMNLVAPDDPALESGTPLRLLLPDVDEAAAFPARVISVGNGTLRVRFEALSLAQQRALVRATFSRPDAWEGWDDTAAIDRPLASLREILYFGLRGYASLLAPLTRRFRARRGLRAPPAPGAR